MRIAQTGNHRPRVDPVLFPIGVGREQIDRQRREVGVRRRVDSDHRDILGRMFRPEALGLPPNTKISIAWIDLNEDEARLRMQKRGDPRDNWKLEHWDQYVTRRIDPPIHSSLHRFDNANFNEIQFDHLIDQLIQN